MTFLELQELVGDWVDDPNFGYFSRSIVKKRLNLGLRELQKHMISANEEYYSKCVKTSTVASQKAYALPSDFIQIIRLEKVLSGSGDNVKTDQITYITPNQRNLIPDVSGDPTNYYFEKNNLILVPTPVRIQEIHLEYSYLVADMVNDSDEPDAPEQFHEYIAILATRDCFLKDGRSLSPIESKMGEYKTLLKQIAEQRRADGSRMVVTTDAWGIF